MPAVKQISTLHVTLPPGWRWGTPSGGSLNHAVDHRRHALCGYIPSGGADRYSVSNYRSAGKACRDCVRKFPDAPTIANSTWGVEISFKWTRSVLIQVDAPNVDAAHELSLKTKPEDIPEERWILARTRSYYGDEEREQYSDPKPIAEFVKERTDKRRPLNFATDPDGLST